MKTLIKKIYKIQEELTNEFGFEDCDELILANQKLEEAKMWIEKKIKQLEYLKKTGGKTFN